MRGVYLGFVALAGVACAPGPADAGAGLTLRIDGGQDAIVAYHCDFTDGGHAEGSVTPPWSDSWAAEGARCDVEQVVGQRAVTVQLLSDGSRATVSTAGRGSSVRLTIGRQPPNGG